MIPVVDLSYVDDAERERLVAAWEESSLRELYELRMGPDYEPDFSRFTIMATRRLAHDVVARHPEVNGPVLVDCSRIEVMSTPFCSELWKLWPELSWVHANVDVFETIEVVRQHRA